MGRRNNYLTNDEIFEIECALYNNLPTPLDNFIAEDTIDEDDQWLQETLLEGEEYTLIENYMLTSYGRWINTHTKRQLRPIFTTYEIFCYLTYDNRLRMEVEFEKLGWKWDFREIVANYYREGWDLQIASTYKKHIKKLPPRDILRILLVNKEEK